MGKLADNKCYSKTQSMKILGCGENTLHRLLKEGQLKFGPTTTMITMESVDGLKNEWEERKRNGSGPNR